MVKKLIRNGKVGVLISTGYGAGWTTWAYRNDEDMLFSPEIIELVEKGATSKEIEEKAKELWGDNNYYGGVDGLEIEWLDEGTTFDVVEYDGYESIIIIDDESCYIA